MPQQDQEMVLFGRSTDSGSTLSRALPDWSNATEKQQSDVQEKTKRAVPACMTHQCHAACIKKRVFVRLQQVRHVRYPGCQAHTNPRRSRPSFQGCKTSPCYKVQISLLLSPATLNDLPWGKQTRKRRTLPRTRRPNLSLPCPRHPRLDLTTTNKNFLPPRRRLPFSAGRCLSSGFAKPCLDRRRTERSFEGSTRDSAILAVVQVVLLPPANDLHAAVSRPVARTVSVSDLDLHASQPSTSQPHVSPSPRLSILPSAQLPLSA
ncbi:hypothetical protein IWZ00DRAFT_488573 [Phyllosticta capitalensis]|uniref:Uncharacterized protein n=1 Tax=Phyllosticta capitalensis TaxID=121624 RepID=A0ABR1YUS5_9PEZI